MAVELLRSRETKIIVDISMDMDVGPYMVSVEVNCS